MQLVQVAVGCLPLVVALVIAGSVNLARPVRVRQWPMPIIASAFAVVILLATSLAVSPIDAALADLFELIPALAGRYDVTWLTVLENVVVVLVYLVVRAVALPALHRAMQGEVFRGSGLVSDAYAFDPIYRTWFVRPHAAAARTLLTAVWGASLGATLVLVTLMVEFPAWPGFGYAALPSLACLVIGEVRAAMGGLTREEYRRDVLGEADRADRLVDYTALRRVLTETFPEQALADGMGMSSEDAVESFALLDEFAASEQDSERMTAQYFARRKAEGQAVDVTLLDATTQLLRGRSVFITDPFHHDLTDYLGFAVYVQLLRGRRCLLVTGRDAGADELQTWIETALASVTGIPGLWGVGTLSRDVRPGDLDVGVLRPADLHDLDLLAEYDDFFADVGIVLLAEPAKLLATGQIPLSLVVSRCGRRARPVFCAFDRHHDGLVDALSHLVRTEIIDVVAAPLPRGVTSHVLWRAEGAPPTVLPPVARSLGAGTHVATVALRYDVGRVEWVGGDAYPVEDAVWIAGQYFSQIAAFAETDVTQHSLSRSLRPHAHPWGLVRDDHRFLVVEDEINNAFESVRLYATRADRQGFVNVVSDDYLLRDYMIAQREILEADARAVPSLSADYARTDRNLAYRLVLELLAFGLSERELVERFETSGWPGIPIQRPTLGRHRDPEPAVVTELRRIALAHLGIDDLGVITELVLVDSDEDGSPVHERRLRITPSAAVTAVARRLSAATFYDEDARVAIGSTVTGLVYQRFLPGQLLTHGGKLFQVVSLVPDDAMLRTTVVLRRAADHLEDRAVYRQLRRFTLTDVVGSERAGADVTIDGVRLRHLFATVQVETPGYLEMRSRRDVDAARRVSLAGVPVRRYRGKEVLSITLPGATPAVRRTIVDHLNEVFVTTFPDGHHYVRALAVGDGDGDGGVDVLEAEDRDAIHIVEDSDIDLGLLVTVERNWRRLFEIVADYLAWSRDAEAEPAAPVAREDYVPVFPGDDPDDVERRHRERDAPAAGSEPVRRRRFEWLRRWLRRPGGATARAAAPTAGAPEAPPAVSRPTVVEHPEEEA